MTTKLNKEESELFDVAKKELHLADYLLRSTFTLTKDTKVLLGVVLHLHKAQQCLLDLLVGTKEPNFTKQMIALKKLNQTKNICSEKDFRALEHVHNLQQEHDSCPVEFVKKEKVVLCDDDYAMKFVEAPILGQHLHTTQLLFKKVLLVKEHDSKR